MADLAFSSKNPQKFYSSTPTTIRKYTQPNILTHPGVNQELEFYLNKENKKGNHADGDGEHISGSNTTTSNNRFNKGRRNSSSIKTDNSKNHCVSIKRKYEPYDSCSNGESKIPLQSLQPYPQLETVLSHGKDAEGNLSETMEFGAVVPQITGCISNNDFLQENNEGLCNCAKSTEETNFDAIFSRITHNVGKARHYHSNSKKEVSISNENVRVKRQYKSLDIKRVASAKARFSASSTISLGISGTSKKLPEYSNLTLTSRSSTVPSVIEISADSTTLFQSPTTSASETPGVKSFSLTEVSTESSLTLTTEKPGSRTSTTTTGSQQTFSMEQKTPNNYCNNEDCFERTDKGLDEKNEDDGRGNGHTIANIAESVSIINTSNTSTTTSTTTMLGNISYHNNISKTDTFLHDKNISATPDNQTAALPVDFESPVLFGDECESGCSSSLSTTCDSSSGIHIKNAPASPSPTKADEKISLLCTPPILNIKQPARTPNQISMKDEAQEPKWSNSLGSKDFSYPTALHYSNDEKYEEVQNVICKLLLSPRETCGEAKQSAVAKKTPKKQEKVNTILNYFRTSPQVEKTLSGSPLSGSCDCGGDSGAVEMKITKKKKQGFLTQSPIFDLPIPRPRLNATYQRGPIHSRMKDKKQMTKKIARTNKKEQMYIDIGQKNFGHVKCTLCGMIYTEANEDDEAQHTKFHQKIVAKLQFKGWKDERVVEECPDGRIIMVTEDDHPSHVKKLSEVREVVDAELGFSHVQNSHPASEQQAFLFVMAKKVVGCAIAVHISKAYPVIPHAEEVCSPGGCSSASTSWCCSADAASALVGVSRIWVLSHHRRQGIATRLVDSVRYNCLYGCVVPKEKVAFSDPTPNGRVFAEKYIGKKEILVFR